MGYLCTVIAAPVVVYRLTAPPTWVEVRVLAAESGEPLRNALVVAMRDEVPSPFDFAWFLPRQSTTNSSGWARLESGDEEVVELVATALGRAPEYVVVWRSRRGATRTTVRLPPSGVLSGLVVDADGHPVPRAHVSLSVPSAYPFRRTGEDGRFVLDEVPLPGGMLATDLTLSVSPDTRGSDVSFRVSPLRSREDRDVTIRLPSPLRFRGRLVDVEGRPRAHETVGLTTSEREDRVATTDSTGAFLFEGIDREVDTLRWGEGDEALDWDFDLPPRGDYQRTFVVPSVRAERREIRIRVVDAESRPVRGFKVSGQGVSDHTSEDGLAVLRLAGEEVTVYVSPPEEPRSRKGWKRPHRRPRPSRSEVIRLSDPSTHEITLAQERGEGSIAGRVVTPGGLPAAGANVRLYGSRFAVRGDTRADALGRFRFDGLEPEPFMVLAYTTETHWGAVQSEVAVGSDSLLLRLPVRRRRTVEIDVREATGEPVLQRSLLAVVSAGDREWITKAKPSAPPGRYRTPEGAWRDVGPGPHAVRVIVEKLDAFAGSVSLQSEGAHLLSAVLPASGRLEGVVRGPDLQPVAGARVLIGRPGWENEPRGSAHWLRITDLEGRFDVPRVPDGKYEVSTDQVGWVSLPEPVEISEAGTARVELRLEAAGRIEVWPSEPRAAPRGSSIDVTRPDREDWSRSDLELDEHENFPWLEGPWLGGDFPPGRYEVTLWREESEPMQWQVDVQAGETAILTVPP